MGDNQAAVDTERLCERLRALAGEMCEGDPKAAGMLTLAAKVIEDRRCAASERIEHLERVRENAESLAGDRLARIEALEREIQLLAPDAQRYRKWRAADRASTADTVGEIADWHMQLALAQSDTEFDDVIDTLPPLSAGPSEP